MSDKRIQELAEKFIAAWNTQEVDKVAACCSEDLVYIDSNLKGEITDQQALRRYLAKLFVTWKMTWAIKDVQAFKNIDGAAVCWHATWQLAGVERPWKPTEWISLHSKGIKFSAMRSISTVWSSPTC